MSGDDAPKPTPRAKMVRLLVWGFGALGVVAAIALIFLAVTVADFMSAMPHRSQPTLKAAKDPDAYRVRDITDVRGTDWLAIDIEASGGERGLVSSGARGGDQRNLILLDRRNGDNRRVLADNSRQIIRTAFFPADGTTLASEDNDSSGSDIDTVVDPAAGATKTKRLPPLPPYAYYLIAVRQSKGDAQDLLVGTLASGQQAFVMKGIDRIERMWMLTPTRLALVLSEHGALFYRVVDIPALKVAVGRQIEIE